MGYCKTSGQISFQSVVIAVEMPFKKNGFINNLFTTGLMQSFNFTTNMLVAMIRKKKKKVILKSENKSTILSLIGYHYDKLSG